jgi:hypothetical protein
MRGREQTVLQSLLQPTRKQVALGLNDDYPKTKQIKVLNLTTNRS